MTDSSISARTAVETARSYWAVECARDLRAVLDHYHPDAVFHHPGARLVGHDQIIGYYSDSAERFPGLTVELLGEVVDGDRAAIEWEAVLTDHDGVAHPLKGVNVIHVEDGRFREVHAYFDPATLEDKG